MKDLVNEDSQRVRIVFDRQRPDVFVLKDMQVNVDTVDPEPGQNV